MSYGLDMKQYEQYEQNGQNGQNGYVPVSNVVLHLDMAKVLDSYANGMYLAFQMGRQVKADELGLVPNQEVVPPSLPVAESTKAFLGVYDMYAYGVYDDEGKYNNSRSHWHGATVKTCIFPSREEALAYARKGVAEYRGVGVESIQPWVGKMNWRQQA